MLPFDVKLTSGAPIYEQLDRSIRRALASGALRAGESFPSVRAISRELRINPNTTHKVVAALVSEGLLEVIPGRGALVSESLPSPAELREGILGEDARRLVAEARRLNISKREFNALIDRLWRNDHE